MYKNLKEYIDRLEREGQLVRVSAKVDPRLEICEITDRVSKSEAGGPALLFENTGTGFPVITNMLGSERRIAMALGVKSLDELTARIDKLFATALSPKKGLWDKLSVLPTLGEVSRWLPRNKRGRGRAQEVILRGDDIDLGEFPILQCWPHDGGRFVTLPLVNTLDPDTGARNVGMYRMQVLDKNTTGMHWHLHKTGERHYRRYQELGQRMPVAVCLGGDPAYTYAATAPMPDNMDEYLLAGFIRRRAVRLVKCLDSEIRVPADCDFVIEGYIDPTEAKTIEGPFGDHTGFYSLKDLYPKFHITTITHRHDAIYPATIVGVPPQEDAYIGMATEKIFLSPIRLAMAPEVKDLYMPPAGVAHNIAIVNIDRNSYRGQGFRIANSLWGAGQMMFNKFLIVTATQGDIRSVDVIRNKLISVQIPQDILFGRGPLDILDHTSAQMGFGGKMAIDLTGVEQRWGDSASGDESYEEFGDEHGDEFFHSREWICTEGVSKVDKSIAHNWRTLLLKAPTAAELDINKFIEANIMEGIKFIAIFDESVDTSRLNDLLWLASGNADAQRDVRVVGSLLVVDARIKAGREGFERDWPNVVTSDRKTIELVDSRRKEYGLDWLPDSPSLRYEGLVGDDAAIF